MPDLNPPKGDSDFYFVPAEDPETAVSRILELVRTRIPNRFGLNPGRDVQVLCPMNRGGAGAEPRWRTKSRALRAMSRDVVVGRNSTSGFASARLLDHRIRRRRTEAR